MGASAGKVAGARHLPTIMPMKKPIAAGNAHVYPTSQAADSQAHVAIAQAEQCEIVEAVDHLEDKGTFKNLLDRLSGSVSGRNVETTAHSTEPLQNDTYGRLTTAEIRLMLEASTTPGKEDMIVLFQRRKSVEAALWHQFSTTSCLPVITELAGPDGVSAFAQWPPEFPRRSI